MLGELILDELKNTSLDGITVLNVVSEADIIRVIFEFAIPEKTSTEIEFEVNENYQVTILKATHEGVVYQELDYLSQFENLVFDMMTKVKLVEKKIRQEYALLLAQTEKQPLVMDPVEQARWDAIVRREEAVRKEEEELDAKEEEIRLMELLLQGKENAISLLKREEEDNLEARRLENREKLENRVKKKFKR